MYHFVKYNDLGDWQDENVLLVDIAPDNTATLRRLTDGSVDAVGTNLSMPQAIGRAKEAMALAPWLDLIAVHMAEGAEWDPSWGTFTLYRPT